MQFNETFHYAQKYVYFLHDILFKEFNSMSNINYTAIILHEEFSLYLEIRARKKNSSSVKGPHQ